MDRVGANTYRCTLCNSTVMVESEERRVTMIAAQSGQPNMRVVSVGDEEVHRCIVPDAPRSVPH